MLFCRSTKENRRFFILCGQRRLKVCSPFISAVLVIVSTCSIERKKEILLEIDGLRPLRISSPLIIKDTFSPCIAYALKLMKTSRRMVLTDTDSGTKRIPVVYGGVS
jgi:hypothetical protein